MAKATCSSCGNRYAFNDEDVDYEPWMPPCCPECTLACSAGEVLDDIHAGDLCLARTALSEIASEWPPQGSIVQTLINEADDAVRKGDFTEAELRQRLAARPKRLDLDDCKKQYAAAMHETLRAMEACV